MTAVSKKTVFVGLSGGVDSSVAALRLRDQGYTVVGVFIKVWHPDFLECDWEQERLDAMRIAAKLKIPFLTCDAQQEYKDDVADYFISEYKAGRTPNPDVMCNRYIKFGAFLKFALSQKADYIATGHYAQNVYADKRYHLIRGNDVEKDQSYFLWTLTQKQLANILLPVGNSTKSTIRAEARINGLITAEKKDSQGICFLGHVDITDFLSHYVELKKGDVLNEKGEVVGFHNGALVYTQGQRHGFTITEETSQRVAYFVISKDLATNTITVGTQKPFQNVQSVITLKDTNYVGWEPLLSNTIEIQTRYRQKPTRCVITAATDKTLTLTYKEKSEQVSEGQSCVLYIGDRCIGGGIIS